MFWQGRAELWVIVDGNTARREEGGVPAQLFYGLECGRGLRSKASEMPSVPGCIGFVWSAVRRALQLFMHYVL